MRVAVYSDVRYRRARGAVWTDESFAVWATGLRDFSSALVLIGRELHATEGDQYQLRRDVQLAPLPDYDSLARIPVKALAISAARLWRVLEDVDVAWLLGPHPLALGLALIALVRGRRVVLGVRQDMPSHIRARHPRRWELRLAALMLEAAWRLLAWRCRVVVVGAELAARYRHARALLQISISLIDEREIVSFSSAIERDYGGDLTALSVGRLDPEKNPLLLAEVLAGLRRRDARWRLVVCGTGMLSEQLAERLRALGIEDAASLRGYVPLARLREVYRTSHVMLHVSWTEGVPQVLFEAFAHGLPVVATDVGGVRQAVDQAALLVQPGSAQQLIDAASRIAAYPQLRATLIERGLEQAAANAKSRTLAGLAAFLEGRESC